MCCCVLQCFPVCCSVLQCVAVCCSVLQCVAVCGLEQMTEQKSALETDLTQVLCVCVAVCCGVLQCVALCCSALLFVAVRCNVLHMNTPRHTVRNPHLFRSCPGSWKFQNEKQHTQKNEDCANTHSHIHTHTHTHSHTHTHKHTPHTPLRNIHTNMHKCIDTSEH